MSKEYTGEEVKELFLRHVNDLIAYWEKQSGTTLYKMEGLAFSMLATIDGSDGIMPKFILAPDPHPEDKEYHIEKKSDYYPENHKIENEIRGNISGGLHELINKYK